MKLKDISVSKFLFTNLLVADIYFGYTKCCTNKNFYFYLRGFRQKAGVLNLQYTAYSLYKLSYLIIQLLNEGKKIIFVGFPDIFNEQWRQLENLSNMQYVFIDYCWNDNYLVEHSKEIGLILAFNNFDHFDSLIKEGEYLTVPFGGLTCSNISYFDFSVVGNFQSSNSIMFFYYFLLNNIRFFKKSK